MLVFPEETADVLYREHDIFSPITSFVPREMERRIQSKIILRI